MVGVPAAICTYEYGTVTYSNTRFWRLGALSGQGSEGQGAGVCFYRA